MNAKRTVAVTLLASLLAGVSLTAFAFGGDGKPQREEMRQNMRAYHEAVMSGALTDAELGQLKKERDAVHAQMQKLHQQLLPMPLRRLILITSTFMSLRKIPIRLPTSRRLWLIRKHHVYRIN